MYKYSIQKHVMMKIITKILMNFNQKDDLKNNKKIFYNKNNKLYIAI